VNDGFRSLNDGIRSLNDGIIYNLDNVRILSHISLFV